MLYFIHLNFKILKIIKYLYAIQQIDKHLYEAIKEDPEDLVEYSNVLAGGGGKPGNLTLVGVIQNVQLNIVMISVL